jgi:hypothetical protein
MRWLGLFLLFIISTEIARAEETLSWRLPKDVFGQSKELELIPIDPAAAAITSAFIQPGDRLLKTRETPAGIQWIVWNDQTQRWIAKGTWMALTTLNETFRMDRFAPTIEVTFRMDEVKSRSSAPDRSAAPLATKTLHIRTGAKAVEGPPPAENGQPYIRTLVEGTFWRFENPVMHLNSSLTGIIPGRPHLSLATSFFCNHGEPCWIARDFDGTRGLDLSATARALWFDGTPLAERLMIEKQAKAVPLQDARNYLPLDEVVPLGNGRWLLKSYWSFLMQAQQHQQPAEDAANPFEDSETEPLPFFKSIARPEALKPWVDHELLDALPVLTAVAAEYGIPNDGALLFAGGDPFAGWLYTITSDFHTAEMVRDLMMGLTRDFPAQLSITLQDQGERRLLMLEGHNASLARISEEQTETQLHFNTTTFINPHETDMVITESITSDDNKTETRTTKLTTADGLMIPIQLINEKDQPFPMRIGVRKENPFSR